MKYYLTLIKHTQNVLLGVSIALLVTLPAALTFLSEAFTPALTDHLYTISHTALFFVMAIRPLADIFISVTWIRPLVILRKGAGVLSASIIVSFLLASVMTGPLVFLSGFISPAYWSLHDLVLFAHLADISAIVLLVTSNNLAKRILGKWWKRVQRLSYLYFYGSAVYVIANFGNHTLVVYVLIVAALSYTAFLVNHIRRRVRPTTV